MRRHRAFAAAVVVLGAVVAVRAQQQPPTFTATSDTVPIFTTVTDKSGRLATNLAREDFQILDGGKAQPITVFDVAPQPIRLVVLVDISGSMVGNLGLVRDATHELVVRLLPGDLARVGTFGNRIDISPNFTRDEGALMAALPHDLVGGQRTPLWEAADLAMNGFEKESGRRVILILSDGKDSGPLGKRYLTSIEIGDRAEREDVMIYGVGLQSRGGQRIMPRPGENMATLLAQNFPDPALGTVALNSGGGYFELRARDDFGAVFARVMDELHQQYLLGFTPAKLDGKAHKIEVKVAKGDMKVRARKTYRAAKATN
jgi:Ca-activated chloride channel family protein